MSSVHVADLDFPPALDNVSFDLPYGARCLLVGANGAGKSTLLQILAGKRLTHSDTCVLGAKVFFNTPQGVTYLGTEWAANSVVRSDILVSRFLDSVGGYRHKKRRDRLLEILDVDLDWHMHQISDGERRRVQIVQGLMAPWRLLLLDEVTVDLDVLVRSELLQYLINETKSRDATIIYATHIFDGLDEFPTHVCHLNRGHTDLQPLIDWTLICSVVDSNNSEEQNNVHNLNEHDYKIINLLKSDVRKGSKLLTLALWWLKGDKLERKELESRGLYTARGPKQSSVPTDSETFYRKYDYSK